MEPKSKQSCPFGLPKRFKFVRVEGEGSFGKVVKCLDTDTYQIVVVKMPKSWNRYCKNERSILETIMRHNLDKCNIVKYIECFQTIHGKALVFESLDMSLYDYLRLKQYTFAPLSLIRTVVQQLATAFDALKGIGVIHTDLKLNNIMIVNRHQQPLQVKLIDFGIAIHTSEANKFRGRQIPKIKPPEVIMKGKINEAIDMWALGIAMFMMIHGRYPFRGEGEIEIMISIIDLLGKPADHSLEKLPKAKIFFKKTDGVWSIKSFVESVNYRHAQIQKKHKLRSLDQMKAMRLEKDNPTEAVEREQCIELLKAMLTFDADERITPREVLAHPFITKVYPSVQTVSEGIECEPRAAPLDDKAGSIIQPGDCPPSPEILPSGLILVRPVTAEDTTLLEDQESTDSEPTAAPLRDEAGRNIQPGDCPPSPEILPSGVILVRPVTAEDTTLLEDQESTDSEPTAAPLRDEAASNIQPGDCPPYPEILPSGVILVRPHSSAESSTLLEIQVSFQSGLNKKSESAVINADSIRKTSDDSTTCEETGPKENGKKKKKKKNFFRRVVSWLRKTFSSRVSPAD